MINSMDIISCDKANAAYSRALSRALELRRRADVQRRLAELDGAYFTRRIEERLRQLIPEAYRIGVSARVYNYGRFVSVDMFKGGCGNDYRWDICVTTSAENRRVDGALLKRQADDDEKAAKELEETAARAYELIGQYNALATAYAGIYGNLSMLFGFDALPYADFNLRRKA